MKPEVITIASDSHLVVAQLETEIFVAVHFEKNVMGEYDTMETRFLKSPMQVYGFAQELRDREAELF